ncbi:MAG: hypothetical protein ACKO37_04770 [Vampirovibrionales bacterium]
MMIHLNTLLASQAGYTYPKRYGEEDTTHGASNTPPLRVNIPLDAFATPPVTPRPVTPPSEVSTSAFVKTTNPFNFGYNPQVPSNEKGILRPVITSQLPAHLQGFGGSSLCGTQLCVMG